MIWKLWSQQRISLRKKILNIEAQKLEEKLKVQNFKGLQKKLTSICFCVFNDSFCKNVFNFLRVMKRKKRNTRVHFSVNKSEESYEISLRLRQFFAFKVSKKIIVCNTQFTCDEMRPRFEAKTAKQAKSNERKQISWAKFLEMISICAPKCFVHSQWFVCLFLHLVKASFFPFFNLFLFASIMIKIREKFSKFGKRKWARERIIRIINRFQLITSQIKPDIPRLYSSF